MVQINCFLFLNNTDHKRRHRGGVKQDVNEPRDGRAEIKLNRLARRASPVRPVNDWPFSARAHIFQPVPISKWTWLIHVINCSSKGLFSIVFLAMLGIPRILKTSWVVQLWLTNHCLQIEHFIEDLKLSIYIFLHFVVDHFFFFCINQSWDPKWLLKKSNNWFIFKRIGYYNWSIRKQFQMKKEAQSLLKTCWLVWHLT